MPVTVSSTSTICLSANSVPDTTTSPPNKVTSVRVFLLPVTKRKTSVPTSPKSNELFSAAPLNPFASVALTMSKDGLPNCDPEPIIWFLNSQMEIL